MSEIYFPRRNRTREVDFSYVEIRIRSSYLCSQIAVDRRRRWHFMVDLLQEILRKILYYRLRASEQRQRDAFFADLRRDPPPTVVMIYSQDSAGVLNVFFDRDLRCEECRCLFWNGSTMNLQGYDLSFELGSFILDQGVPRSRAADVRFYQRSTIYYPHEICAELTFEALQQIYDTFFQRRPAQIPERSQRDPTAGAAFWHRMVDLWRSQDQERSAYNDGALSRRPTRSHDGSQGPY